MSTVIETAPLCAGDHLTREEFLRRWENEPNIKFAELIGGVVYMPSPLSLNHGETDTIVATWLGTYQAFTPGVVGATNSTTMLLDDVPQPDLSLRLSPQRGGAAVKKGEYLHGPPELIVEICQSSASYDLHEKLDLYRIGRVQEYLTILLHDREIRWHQLVSGKYKRLRPKLDVWRSEVFPGLWLNGPALLNKQTKQVLVTLHEGIASSEHQAFHDQFPS